jgi:precorrin-4/cobalt-precorrin-4 C11-methyltransferase
MIHFIGAGPGAPDLITVRGQRLLSEAGLVIYAGSLVNPELLAVTRPDCQILDSASMTLEAVIASMAAAAAAGLDVVRLHTGDPSIYGAIREQMDALDRLELPYEVVPGVSSFCGAAAALEAELTLPDVSQTVILTRMAGRTPVPERESIARLAAHQSTMVIFLSTGLLDELSQELTAGGYAPETPAALVYKASWPDQKVVRTTVVGLPAAAREHAIHKTALVLVGHFLGDHYERSLLYDPAFSHGYRQAASSATLPIETR